MKWEDRLKELLAQKSINQEDYDEKPFILTYKRNEKKFLTIVN